LSNDLSKTLEKIGPRDKAHHFDAFFFRGLDDPKEKDEMRERLLRAIPVLDLVKAYIQNEFNSLSRVKSSDYSSGDWSAKQAHRNGQLEILEKLWKLLP
jgi:hypothetical protein